VGSGQRQSSRSQLKIYTPRPLEPHFEELEQLYQRLSEILPVQSAKREPCIAFQTSYIYSLQCASNTLHDMYQEALIRLHSKGLYLDHL
jgi:hypothetical protein